MQFLWISSNKLSHNVPTKKIKKCKTLKFSGLPVHIEDVRTEIISLKKIPCHKRSDKQREKLQRLQEKLCRLKNKLRPTGFQRSEGSGRKKGIISVKLVGVKNAEESDAIKVLREMDRHQTESVRYECDTIFEIRSGVEIHEINYLEKERLNKLVQGEKSFIKVQEEKENVLDSLEHENVSIMIQTVDEAISLIPTASLNNQTEKKESNGGRN